MTSVHLYDGCRLKEYSAVSKAGKSTITIKIECARPEKLGWLLADLEKIDNDQKLAEKAAKEEARRPKKKQLALPAPPLQLPYFGKDGEA